MRIFVCEYVTGGGLLGAPLPASLAREGDMMVRALARDLAALAGIEVVASRDPQLHPLSPSIIMEVPSTFSEDIWRFWRRCIDRADAVWPIAPETGGILERLSALVLECGRILLGSRPDAVRIAASKAATASHLQGQGVPVVPTRPADQSPPASATGWVVKPGDGAGCDDTRLFRDRCGLERWLDAGRRNGGYVVQPYVPGTPASLSLVCREGRARVLSCNRQLIELENDVFHYRGSIVNGIWDRDGALRAIAYAIAAALPGLWGYVGVDLMLTDKGPVVMEVNPRLTTSYVGLPAALDTNPARLVLDLLRNPERAMNLPPGNKPGNNRSVRVEVEEIHG